MLKNKIHIVELINGLLNSEGGQVTVFRAPHFLLIESGHTGAGGGRHRRLHGRMLLSIPQVSQHVLELRPVWSWRRRRKRKRRKMKMGDKNQRRKQEHGVRRRPGDNGRDVNRH